MHIQRNFILKSAALGLLLAPAAVFAQGKDCQHSDARQLQLDLSGVKTVVFEVGQHKLRLDGASGTTGSLQGRACASNRDWLPQLILEQKRSGDRLTVSLRRDGQSKGIFIGQNYAFLDLSGSLPANIPVQVKVGSGDAWITGTASLDASVGSGDLEAKRIPGAVTASVGSGDIELDQTGPLKISSIGSGDVVARNVRGDTHVGSIGSGDFELDGGQGNVDIGSIGSGDADVRNITGNVTVGSIGSGDLDVQNVGGNLTVRSKGSGSVDHSGVKGTVNIPRKR